MKAGAVFKYDLSLPLENMYDLVLEMRARLGNNEFLFVACSCREHLFYIAND